jgi:predicted alpha/beta-fold hydrolase
MLAVGGFLTKPILKCRKKPHVMYDREILRMPDGGCVALDTEDVPEEKVQGVMAQADVAACH